MCDCPVIYFISLKNAGIFKIHWWKPHPWLYTQDWNCQIIRCAWHQSNQKKPMFLWKWLWQHLSHQPCWQFSFLYNLPNTWIYWVYNFPNTWIYWIVRFLPTWWVLHGISLWFNLYFLSTMKVENLFILLKNYLKNLSSNAFLCCATQHVGS